MSITNSLYRRANFYNLVYTGKLISGKAIYWLLVHQHQLPKVFSVRYGFVVGRYYVVAARKLISVIRIIAHVWFSETYNLVPCYKFFAASANLTNQS